MLKISADLDFIILQPTSTILSGYGEKNKKISEGKNSKKSVIWGMSSSWVSPISASWYHVTPSRSHETLLDFLKDLDIKQYANNQVSDGYSGYFKGMFPKTVFR